MKNSGNDGTSGIETAKEIEVPLIEKNEDKILDENDENKSKENQENTEMNKLEEFIKYKRELLPENFSSIEELKQLYLNQKSKKLSKNACIWSFDKQEGDVQAMAVSSDDKYVVSSTYKGDIKIFDLESKNEIRRFSNSGDVRALVLSDDCKYIVTGANDKIKAFDFTTKEQVFSIPNPHQGDIFALAITNDGKYIISAGQDKSIRFIDFSDQKEEFVFQNIHEASVLRLVRSKDGKILVSSSADFSIKLFDLEKREQKHHFVNAHKSQILAIAIANDNDYLVSGGRDGSVKIFDLEYKNEAHNFENAHRDMVTSIALSRNGTRIISGSKDCMVKVFDLYKRTLLHEFQGYHYHIITAIFALNQKDYVVTGSYDSTIKIFDFVNKRLVYSFSNPHMSDVDSLAISKDNQYIVTGSRDKSIKIFDFKNKEQIHHFERVHNDEIYSIALSKNNKYIVSGSWDKSIKIFDFKEKQQIHHFVDVDDAVRSVAITNDEEYIVSGGESGTLKIFSIQEKKEVSCLKRLHDRFILSVYISKDDKYIITGSLDRSIKVIDFKTRVEIRHIQNVHAHGVSTVVISSYNKYIISGSWDKSIKVFDFETKQLIHHIQDAHAADVRSIAISDDDKYLISGGEDRSIKVWDLESYGELCNFKNVHQTGIMSVAISSDNQYILSGSSDASFKAFLLEVRPTSEEMRIQDFSHLFGTKLLKVLKDNKRLLVVAGDGELRIFDLETKKQIEIFMDQNALTSSALSKDEKYIVYGLDYQKEVRVFDFKTKELVCILQTMNKENNVVITGDNKTIIAASEGKTIEAFDLETKKQKWILDDSEKVGKIALSGNDRYLAMAYQNGTIKLIDPDTTNQLYKFQDAHKGSITSLVISNDGKYLVSTGNDRSIKIFDLQMKQEVFEFKNVHILPVTNLDLSYNGNYVISRTYDNGTKIFDIHTKQMIYEFKDVNPSNLCFTRDDKQIIYKVKNEFVEIISTPLSGDEIYYVSPKISPALDVVKYDDILLSFHDELSRNTFLCSYNEMYIAPHAWTLLHLLAIFNPSVIPTIPKYADFRIPFLVDKHGKTPLHYILAHKTLDYRAANVALEYINDYLEDISQKRPYETQIIFNSLSNLFLFIIAKAPSRLSQKYLTFCYPPTSARYGETIPYFGKAEQVYTFSPASIMLPEVRDIIYQEGDDQIVFRTNMAQLDYDPRSDDMLMTTHVLSEVEDIHIFKLPIIENLIDHLWNSTQKTMYSTLALFSILMIILSLYIGFGDRNLVMEISILLLTCVFIGIEIIQMMAMKNEYLNSIWNWVDISQLIFIIVFIGNRLAGIADNVPQAWMTSAVILVGYLRWISYLRLYTPTRHLIEIILVVLYDMLGFLTIISSILVGFSLVFLQFNRVYDNPLMYSTHFYNTFKLMFGNYDDTDYSLSEILLVSSLMVVLNVILLNLLISIIGDSYGKVKDQQELVDAKARIDMIYDAIVLMRRINPIQEVVKGYLIYCLPASLEEESLERLEWKARLRQIGNLLKQSESGNKKDTSQLMIKMQNNIEEGMNKTLDRVQKQLEQKVSENMNVMEQKMDEKINKVRNEVEAMGQRILANIIEQKVSENMNAMEQKMDEKLNKVRSEIEAMGQLILANLKSMKEGTQTE